VRKKQDLCTEYWKKRFASRLTKATTTWALGLRRSFRRSAFSISQRDLRDLFRCPTKPASRYRQSSIALVSLMKKQLARASRTSNSFLRQRGRSPLREPFASERVVNFYSMVGHLQQPGCSLGHRIDHVIVRTAWKHR